MAEKVRFVIPEVVEFSDDSTTERGEKIYKHLEITLHSFGETPIRRVIKADAGLGFTEEYIEETIQGGLKALEADYPNYKFRVVRDKPNQIRLVYDGVRGVLQ
jgi:hypothetical protein